MATDLKQLQNSRQHPPIIVLHGQEGTGKSTTANQFPKAFWLNLENSTYDFAPCMVQVPKTYEEVIDLLTALRDQEHEYRTIIIDTLDKLEIMMGVYVCANNGWDAIGEPAYGKGYEARTNEFQRFWALIKDLNERKNMIVVLIAHSQVVKVEDPILPTYDCHAIQLYKKESAFVKREADLVGYCMIESYTSNDGKRNIATTAGEHQIRTHHNPAYDAKTRRASMPDVLPMNAKAILDCYRKPTTKKED